jgi:choline kinase
MKVVILGAGSGSRLKRDVPKPLVHLSEGLTILDLQLRYLTRVVRVEDIIVVVGFRSDLIAERYPYLRFAHNDRYAHTNTAASLRVGLDAINEDDVLWLNGDVVFSGEVLSDLERRPAHNLVWVSNHSLGDEEIKYTLDSEGYVKKLSKTVKNGLGEGVGINFIRSEDVPHFKSCLSRCADSDYFERAMELAIAMGVKFKPSDVRDRFCVEVDFEEDLQKAKAYAKVAL